MPKVRAILIAIAMLMTLNVYANTDPISTGFYPSASDAAAAAGQQYFSMSARYNREYMGGILEHRGDYFYTVSKGVFGRDKVKAKIQIPNGSRLVGLWHTHGSPHYSRTYFSKTDTQLVETMGMPLFLTDPKGSLRVFRPGDKRLTVQQSLKLGLGWSNGNARGRQVALREKLGRC